MDRATGLIGIAFIFGVALLISNNRRAINLRVILSGLALQIVVALFILKVPIGQRIIQTLGSGITRLVEFSDVGAQFVFGPLANGALMDSVFGTAFVFFFKIIPTIIFMAVLVNIGYFFHIIQWVVSIIARVVYWIMGVSGAEALSNVSSAFVGQVEAQILIRPYLDGMTKSELLASMTGSMACIAGGVMAVYISMGIPAEFLIAASLMAAPGALVISKIVYPETEQSQTLGRVKLDVKRSHSNLIDAIVGGATDGLRVGLNVVAMVIAFIALIALVNGILGYGGRLISPFVSLDVIGMDINNLSLNSILGRVFSFVAVLLGVPIKDMDQAGALLGTKMVTNEFIAYSSFSELVKAGSLSAKTVVIVSFALCGFANFGSIGVQVGGISQLAPSRRSELAKLGFRALICGTLASYLSAAIAGILM